MRRVAIVAVLVGSVGLPLTGVLGLDDKKRNDNGDTVVYVIPNGTSYHKSARCVTLRKSKTANGIALEEAVKQGKSPCLQCSPPVPQVKGPVDVDVTYLAERFPNLTVKSSSEVRAANRGGAKFLQLTLLIEFNKDSQEKELNAIKNAFAEKPSKFKFVALDKDNAVIPVDPSADANFRIEGEITGVRGDAFRMNVGFGSDVTAKAKTLLIREVSAKEKAQP